MHTLHANNERKAHCVHAATRIAFYIGSRAIFLAPRRSEDKARSHPFSSSSFNALLLMNT